MPRHNNESDRVFDSPESVYEFFRKYSQSESFREWKKQIEEGPHPAPEILFDYSVGTLPDSEQDNCLKHIAHCIRCTKEVYTIRAAQRRLSEVTEKSETRGPNWAQILRDIVSPVVMGIRSFVDRVLEIVEPEPTEPALGTVTASRSLMTIGQEPSAFYRPRPSYEKVKTRQFFVGETIQFDIDIPEDGYLTAFTFSESGPMRLVFPDTQDFTTSVKAGQIQSIKFKAPHSPGPWTVRAIWTADDPVGSTKLVSDASWNDRVLACVAEYVIKSNEDRWTVGTLEFTVEGPEEDAW